MLLKLDKGLVLSIQVLHARHHQRAHNDPGSQYALPVPRNNRAKGNPGAKRSST